MRRAVPLARPVRGPLAPLLVALVTAGCAADAERAPLRVFAAASLHELAAELAAGFERREPVAVELNLAGSNTLAQQILAAPGADVFISADRDWVEVVERRGRAVAGSRRALFTNRLVLIERRGAGTGIRRPEELARGGFDHLAVADPAGVPAGRYARQALTAIDVGRGSLWDAVAPRVVPALDVRAALALVESDDRFLGIVYRTDARGSARVETLFEFPPGAAAEVVYWGVLLADGRRPDLAARFLDHLGSPEARAIVRRHGFGLPAAAGGEAE